MAKQPLVSIITPSYNQASFLEKTICSVLTQDYPNLEYWVIDGGSDDGSIDIIQKYAHQLAGWISEDDQGQADAINKGFSSVNGEIVAWLNSDDIYRPGAIKNAVSVLQEHPEVGLVYSDVDSIDSTGNLFNRMTYDDWQLSDLMAFNIIGQASVFMRKTVLEQAGYLDLSYSYLLDHHLWLRIALISKLHYAPGQVWAAARIHPGAKNVAHADGFGQEAYRLAKWMQTNDQFQPYIKGHLHKVWAGAHRINAFYLLEHEKPQQALQAYWRGFWRFPPCILKDWRRIGFALLAPLKPEFLRQNYLDKKKKRIIKDHENNKII